MEAITTLLEDQITPQCVESLLVKWDFADTHCLTLALSKAAGMGIIAGAAAVKLPQLISIVKNKSTAGIDPTSAYLEPVGYIAAALYNYLQGNPFTTYGENLAVGVQSLLTVVCMWLFSASVASAISGFAFGTALFAGVAAAMLYASPATQLILFQSSTAVFLIARVFQIIANFRAGHTGVQSIVSLFLMFVGSAVRVLTVLKEVNGYAVLISVGAAAFLNGVLFFQAVAYRKATKEFLAGNNKGAAAKPRRSSKAPGAPSYANIVKKGKADEGETQKSDDAQPKSPATSGKGAVSAVHLACRRALHLTPLRFFSTASPHEEVLRLGAIVTYMGHHWKQCNSFKNTFLSFINNE